MTDSGLVRRATTHERSWHNIGPEDAGWDWTGLEVTQLGPGETVRLQTEGIELIVLPLSGSAAVRSGSDEAWLTGRGDVFEGVSDFVYIGIDREVEVWTEEGGRFAFPSSRASRPLPFRHVPSNAVSVELRGRGSCSRQVNNFCMPKTFEADRLIACEVLTPAGNWSSFPPHKHDEETEHETQLEEIYYYEISDRYGPAGLAYQRVYGHEDRSIDILAEVRTGDVVLIPFGWHGPTMATPGYDLYYLNVMAGPGPIRAWRICDDPDHAWIRGDWVSQELDPRLPLTARPHA